MLQFQVVYQIGEKAVRRLLYSGELAGIRTGAGWRIVDPGPELLDLMRMQAAELASVPFIRGGEAADLMNVSDRRVRRLGELGTLQYEMRGSRRVYSLESIAAYMAQRHSGHRKQSHTDVRPWVRRWAAANVAAVLRDREIPVPDFLENELAGNSAKSVV